MFSFLSLGFVGVPGGHYFIFLCGTRCRDGVANGQFALLVTSPRHGVDV